MTRYDKERPLGLSVDLILEYEDPNYDYSLTTQKYEFDPNYLENKKFLDYITNYVKEQLNGSN